MNLAPWLSLGVLAGLPPYSRHGVTKARIPLRGYWDRHASIQHYESVVAFRTTTLFQQAIAFIPHSSSMST